MKSKKINKKGVLSLEKIIVSAAIIALTGLLVGVNVNTSKSIGDSATSAIDENAKKVTDGGVEGEKEPDPKPDPKPDPIPDGDGLIISTDVRGPSNLPGREYSNIYSLGGTDFDISRPYNTIRKEPSLNLGQTEFSFGAHDLKLIKDSDGNDVYAVEPYFSHYRFVNGRPSMGSNLDGLKEFSITNVNFSRKDGEDLIQSYMSQVPTFKVNSNGKYLFKVSQRNSDVNFKRISVAGTEASKADIDRINSTDRYNGIVEFPIGFFNQHKYQSFPKDNFGVGNNDDPRILFNKDTNQFSTTTFADLLGEPGKNGGYSTNHERGRFIITFPVEFELENGNKYSIMDRKGIEISASRFVKLT